MVVGVLVDNTTLCVYLLDINGQIVTAEVVAAVSQKRLNIHLISLKTFVSRVIGPITCLSEFQLDSLNFGRFKGTSKHHP